MATGSPEGRIHWRYRVLIAATALLIALVGARYLTLIAGPAQDHGSERPLMIPERGPILDREGKVLAVQTTEHNVTAWKPAVTSPEATAEELASILSLDPAAVLATLKAEGAGFAYVKKRVSGAEEEKLRSAVALGRLRGIGLEPVAGRSYPEGESFSHILGFTGTEGRGLAGIELSFDKDLEPTTRTKAGLQGNSLVLSLDARVQWILRSIAKKAVDDNNALGAMFIAMDGKTGQVLGYVSVPDFDPNDVASSTLDQRMDRPAVMQYEPGSVFKVYSLASLTQLGAIDEHSLFHCDGVYEKAAPSGEKIRITCLAPHGDVTPKLILADSCNVGAAYASDIVSQRDFHDSLRAFGFGERTGIALPSEAPGLFRDVDAWSLRSKPTIAFGQEISVTAVQMAAAATALSSGGWLLKPRVVDKVLSPEGKVLFEARTEPIRKVIDAATARTVLGYMENAAVSTASASGIKGAEDIRLAGKSGTAQKADPATGRYSDSSYMASYLALLPADDPSLILYLVIDTPRGSSIYGGKIAAPLVREAADRLASVLGFRKKTDIDVAVPAAPAAAAREGPVAIGDTMPDLAGKPKKLLVPLLARTDIKVRIIGEGYVARQSPAPGSPVPPGTVVTLELE